MRYKKTDRELDDNIKDYETRLKVMKADLNEFKRDSKLNTDGEHERFKLISNMYEDPTPVRKYLRKNKTKKIKIKRCKCK